MSPTLALVAGTVPFAIDFAIDPRAGGDFKVMALGAYICIVAGILACLALPSIGWAPTEALMLGFAPAG